MNFFIYFYDLLYLVPNGVITFRRFALPNQFYRNGLIRKKVFVTMHLTTSKKIEDIDCVLQVNTLIFLRYLSYRFCFFVG